MKEVIENRGKPAEKEFAIVSLAVLSSFIFLYSYSILQVTMVDYADIQSSSEIENEQVNSKIDVQGTIASSSQSHVKSHFIGMGFAPALVDKAIEESGEDNANLILETLIAYSATEHHSPKSSDSLDEVLGNHEDGCMSAYAIDGLELKAIEYSNPEFSDSLKDVLGNCKDGFSSAIFAIDGPAPKAITYPSPESSDSLDDLLNDCREGTSSSKFSLDGPEVEEDARSSLLMMNFSVRDVDLAIHRLGEDAPVNELVDFILASQAAQNCGSDMNDSTYGDEREAQDNGTESLFQSMEKTLCLLDMGFTENEISSAIEKYGADIPVGELADSIFANRIADTCFEDDKDPSAFHRVHNSHAEDVLKPVESSTGEQMKRPSFDNLKVKTEPSSSGAFVNNKDLDCQRELRGKKPKREYEDYSNHFHGNFMPQAKAFDQKYSPYTEFHKMSEVDVSDKMPRQFDSSPGVVHGVPSKPPYFFFGNVLDISQDTWSKLSQFIYAISPEFVNTQFFSALNRKEGYIHNLPTENRSHIVPKPPMTIEDALPHVKKWWPSWDTRKQLSSINAETNAMSQLCERLGKMLIDSNGMLSREQQTDLLHHCKTWNLLWVGHYKLSPIEPEQLERILGYPVHHTDIARFDSVERLRLLKHCFQTDTLGYHLSSLKHLFQTGLAVLSLYSGIGGAEVALHRLGIRLKCVVSVELCETNRRILRRWWQNAGQTGELVQIEDINKLTSNKLKSLAGDFGGFDLIICQNPCATMSGSSKKAIDNPAGFDFTMFFEFVRVLHAVRNERGNR